MGDTALEFRDVSFKWPDGPELAGINIKIKKGDFALITGPSGSGKSTLLRLAVGLEKSASGAIYINGIPIKNINPETLRSKASFIQQIPTVLNGSVKDNLLLPYSFAVNKKLPVPDDEHIKKYLKKLFLDVDIYKEASSLSAGQKQRLCILRALLTKPEILLADEPTSALDAESRLVTEKLFEKLNNTGYTVLMVSHSDYRPSVPYRTFAVKSGRVREIIFEERKGCTEIHR